MTCLVDIANGKVWEHIVTRKINIRIPISCRCLNHDICRTHHVARKRGGRGGRRLNERSGPIVCEYRYIDIAGIQCFLIKYVSFCLYSDGRIASQYFLEF